MQTTTRPLAALLLVAVLAACVAAESASTQPATQPRTAEQWLERIEQRADDIDTLRAALRYERVAGLLEDRQLRAGTLYYDAGPPPRFAVHFDRAVINNRMREQDRRYIFDGRWLAERQEDQKVFIRRELVPEGEDGEQMLELSGGPFLLPLDLDKDQVLERFEVELVAAEDDDGDRLANAVHLRLTPRPHVDAQQERLDVWYDRDTALPMRVRGQERGRDHWTVDLADAETGVDIDEPRFDTRPPQEPGWQIEHAGRDAEGE
ncbi:MAG: LolA family protein [Phycisphaeraceae bacterium]